MALPMYTPGPVAPTPHVPQGHSNRTLTQHVRKPKKPRAPRHPKVDPLSLPAAPGSSLTVGQLRKLVAAASDEKFGPEQRAIGLRQQQIPAWFAAYRAQIQQQQDAQAARTTGAVDALKGLAASAGAVGPEATPEAQAAAAIRAQGGSGQTQLAQLLGDNQGQFLQNLGLLTNANQIAELSKGSTQLSDLARERSDFSQTYGQQLLSDEAKRRLEAAAFNLNQTKAVTEIQHTKTQDNLARRKVKISSRQAKRNAAIQQQNADTNAYRAHHPKMPVAKKPAYGPGSLNQGAETKIVQSVKGATSLARQLMSKPGANSSEVRHLLAAGFNPATGKYNGQKYDHDVINAAFDLLPSDLGGNGGLSAANVKALRRMGVHVDRYFKRVGRIKKSTGVGGIPSGKM